MISKWILHQCMTKTIGDGGTNGNGRMHNMTLLLTVLTIWIDSFQNVSLDVV